MNRSRVLLAVGAMLMATFVVGGSTPASADPTGTTFTILTDNFQTSDGVEGSPEGFHPAVPFGFPTPIPGSGVTIDSHSSVSVPGPFTLGGKDFLEFWLTTDDGGFLSDDPSLAGGFALSGLNWGPDSPPAVATGVLFLQLDIDGDIVPLDPANGLVLIAPHPVNGEDAAIFPVTGDGDASDLEFGSVLLPIIGALLDPAAGLDPLDVNSFHLSVEIMHVPEPATVALMGLGLCSTLLMRRRRL